VTRKKTNKVPFSDDFIEKIADASAGYLPGELFDKLIGLFETEIYGKPFTKDSESNLLRIVLGMYNKATFLSDCIKYPHYVEILITVALNSNYLTDILVRDPEYFYWIANPSNLNQKIEPQKFATQLTNSANAYHTFQARVNALRSIKRKEFLRIGLRDILGTSRLEETVYELSLLAKSITSYLFDLCHQEILKKHKLDIVDCRYCIIALGKLGGDELNYSSDIDLLFMYDKYVVLPNKKTYSEILTEVIYLFIECATSITESGFIYRVDLRLRPEGRNSPLCGSMIEYLSYYESRGEDWERQMLIKASFAGGSEELYNQFIGYLTNFIYPKSFLFTPTEQIKMLKQNIEKNLLSEENIKLTPGGIRDIEFSVQALQLLNGGRIEELRIPNTPKAIEKLLTNKLISSNEAETLREAYKIYRRTEHYLQLMNDKQTHTIPTEGDILNKLSAYLGFASHASYLNEIKKHRSQVKNIYRSIVGDESNARRSSSSIEGINFENKKKAESDLKYLRDGKGLLGQKQVDRRALTEFKAIESQLINYLKKAAEPDLVLQNFVRIIRFANFPSIWYKEFKDRKFFKSFLNICEFSQKTVDLFAEDKDLREYLLTRKAFEKLDTESLNKLTQKKFIFALLIQFTSGLISEVKVSELLKKYFQQKITGIAEEQLKSNTASGLYFIGAMGSFGSGEMTFNSDIDLIFVTGSSKNMNRRQQSFQKLLDAVRKEIKPVEIDSRLRPEGRSGLLAWDIDSYISYIDKRARIWELQSYSKFNFVCGNESLYKKLANFISTKASSIDIDKIKREMLEMGRKIHRQESLSITNRFNIKKGIGGLSDLDFIVQYYLLNDSRLFISAMGKEVIKTLSLLSKKIGSKESAELKRIYLFLKKTEMANQVVFNSSLPVISFEAKKLKLLSAFLGFNSSNEFLKMLKESTGRINALLQNLLK
jgi:glutamate-ammonia-ligase adenylyltransferase